MYVKTYAGILHIDEIKNLLIKNGLAGSLSYETILRNKLQILHLFLKVNLPSTFEVICKKQLCIINH